MPHETIKAALSLILDAVRDELHGTEHALTKMVSDPEKARQLEDALALSNAWLEVQNVPSPGMWQTPVYKTDKGYRLGVQAWLLAVNDPSGMFRVVAATGSDEMAEAFCQGNDEDFIKSGQFVIRMLVPEVPLEPRPVRHFKAQE